MPSPDTSETPALSCPSCQPVAGPAEPAHATHGEQLMRLRRIEGQIRGIVKMIEDEQYCVEILTQVRAARAALGAVEAKILTKHIRHCLSAAFAAGDEAAVERKVSELVELTVKSSR